MNEKQTKILNYLSTKGHWCSEEELEFLLFETDCWIVNWRYYDTPEHFQVLFQNGDDGSFYKTLSSESKYFNFIRNNFIEDTN